MPIWPVSADGSFAPILKAFGWLLPSSPLIMVGIACRRGGPKMSIELDVALQHVNAGKLHALAQVSVVGVPII